ncbi:dihydrofolate reductase family protein [Pseudonocardia sp. RS11V-5]|uniref:dihydrofolate reductase family protein n=1 Tax=Pseudonocardia terrae TaxID=2905831 RepID=UPI001E356B1F|nr:dihydrofolate reductase family protein [Pseudonocardia terrae]MCE3555181.1 dihydrofolate reductase family protein [Pseudonocardia terrae]
MREIVVSEFVTLDGVMEAPGGEPTHPHTGWVAEHGTPEFFEFKYREVVEAGGLLLGRTTYESFVGAWPQREGDFAERMTALPKYVATSRPEELTWNARPLTGAVVDAVTELKKGDGGPLLVNGSATMVRTLLAAGLVDELRLQVFPVAIGGGLRFWPEDRGKVSLHLADVTRYGDTLVQTYRA